MKEDYVDPSPFSQKDVQHSYVKYELPNKIRFGFRDAKYFHASLTSLARESELLDELIHPLAKKGLDVDALAATVGELNDILRQSRSYVHAFDRGEFAALEKRGRKQVETGRALVTEAEGEYRFRRNGLLVAVGIMALLAAAIYLKIREIESDS